MNLHMISQQEHAERTAAMVAQAARQLPAARRFAYLRKVARVMPATFAALRDLPAPMLHFVGFRGEEYRNAVRAFGPPDFVHRHWDERAMQEVAEGDRVVFATTKAQRVMPWAFDDSNQADDPAALERLEMNRVGEGVKFRKHRDF